MWKFLNSSGSVKRSVAAVKQPCVRVYRTAGLALLAATDTLVPWTHESYDDFSMHDLAVNTTRITIPESGLYHALASGLFDINAGTGERILSIRKNGTTVVAAVRETTTIPNMK